jgi:hypothetical protein
MQAPLTGYWLPAIGALLMMCLFRPGARSGTDLAVRVLRAKGTGRSSRRPEDFDPDQSTIACRAHTFAVVIGEMPTC